MKASLKSSSLKAILACFVLLLVISCSKSGTTPEPDPVYTKPLVYVDQIKSVTLTSATAVVNVVPGESGTTVSLEYRLSSATTWTSKVSATVLSGKTEVSVPFDISDLAGGAEYVVRAKANNIGGETISVEKSFKTVAYTAPVIVIKSAEKVDTTSATIVAKALANDSEATVTLEYKETGTTWGTVLTQIIPVGKDSVTISAGLLSLKKNTVYTFRAKIVNKGGETISSESSFETFAVSDFDGNLYHTVTIGTQTWLKENFRGIHYANGDAIANVTNATTWAGLTTGAYCWYNNDANLGKIYGGLYNFYVGTDPRGLIAGWKVPIGREWSTLRMFLGGYYPAGPALMETGTTHWKNVVRPGNNSTGFTALPNGAFASNMTDGNYVFMNLGEDTVLWTSDVFGPGATTGEISNANSWFAIEYIRKLNMGAGIRLLKK